MATSNIMSPADAGLYDELRPAAAPADPAADDQDACASDLEEPPDDEDPEMQPSEGEAGTQEMLEFGIGHGQAYMKSAQTPAAEKVKALKEDGQGYFDMDFGHEPSESPPVMADDIEYAEDAPPPRHINASTQTPDEELLRPTSEAQDLPSTWKAPDWVQQRSNATRSFIAEAFANTRRRTSSGPAIMAGSVKRLLGDLPSINLPRQFIFPGALSDIKPKFEGMRDQSTALHRSDTPAPARNGWPDPEPVQQASLQRTDAATQTLDVNREFQTFGERSDLLEEDRCSPKQDPGPLAMSRSRSPATGSYSINGADLSPLAKPRSIRRSNSDNSLYMEGGLSRTTTLDDPTRWNDVTEQVNSRFKAITDSLQDSRIRFPRLPTINLAHLRPGMASHSTGDVTGIGLSPDHTRNPGIKSYHIHTDDGIARKINTALVTVEVERGETRAHPIIAAALAKLTGDVLVIGGYRGSILRSAKLPHHQLWVPVKVGLNLRKANLEVGLQDEDEEMMEETIYPDGILSHIGPIDICRRLLRHLKKCPNTKAGKLQVHNYGYDWRLSPHRSSRKLIEFLEKLPCNQPGVPLRDRGATIIAHSLGGLIVRHAVNQRPELFAGVVYAGVPQRCVNILGPLRNGDDVLLSSRVLTAQVNFTMRTSFVLLPEDGRCFIDKHTGERYDIDFFDPKTWEEHRLSPCINPPLRPLSQDHRKGIMDTLTDGLPTLNDLTRRASSFLNTNPPTTVSEEPASASPATKAQDTTAEAAEHPSLGPTMNLSTPPYNPTSISTHCTLSRAAALSYLSRILPQTLAFKRELAHLPAHSQSNRYPPLAVLYSRSVPTVYGAKVRARAAIQHADAYDDLAFAAGDGVVLASAAMLPTGYRYVKGGRAETERGHVGLLGDLERVGRCLAAVVEGRARGVGLGLGVVREERS